MCWVMAALYFTRKIALFWLLSISSSVEPDQYSRRRYGRQRSPERGQHQGEYPKPFFGASGGDNKRRFPVWQEVPYVDKVEIMQNPGDYRRAQRKTDERSDNVPRHVRETHEQKSEAVNQEA